MDFWNLMRRAAAPMRRKERELSAEFDVLAQKVESYITSSQAEISLLKNDLATAKAELDALKAAPATTVVSDPAPEVVNALSAQVDAAAALIDTVIVSPAV